MRPTEACNITLQIRAFSRIGAVSVYCPDLRLVFCARGGKDGEHPGIRRPGRVRVDPFASGSGIDHGRRRFSQCFANVRMLCCAGGRGLHPRDRCAIGRKGDVAVENGFSQLFGQLRGLSGEQHREEAAQNKLLHLVILIKERRHGKGGNLFAGPLIAVVGNDIIPLVGRGPGDKRDHRFRVAHVEDFVRHVGLDVDEITGFVLQQVCLSPGPNSWRTLPSRM